MNTPIMTTNDIGNGNNKEMLYLWLWISQTTSFDS
jgi:hypothetical protein